MCAVFRSVYLLDAESITVDRLAYSQLQKYTVTSRDGLLRHFNRLSATLFS